MYVVRRQPETGRYEVSDPKKGTIPVLFFSELVAFELAGALNAAAERREVPPFNPGGDRCDT